MLRLNEIIELTKKKELDVNFTQQNPDFCNLYLNLQSETAF